MMALPRSLVRRIGRLLVLTSVLLAGGLGAVRLAAAHGTGAAACAAVGTYNVGPQVVPYATPLLGTPGRAQPAYPVPYGLGVLQGTVVLRAYTGCGIATSGSFSVHSALRFGPLPESTRGVPQGKTSIAYPFYGTDVLTATGTLVQDVLHATDPGYVLVRGTVIFGRQSIVCGGICAQPSAAASFPCPQTGCRSGTVITRVATFHDVTGYLRLQPGGPPALGLTFLPPPDPHIAGVGAALSLQPIGFMGSRRGS